MSFQVQVVGKEQLVARFGRARDSVAQAVVDAVSKSGYAVQARAQEKLSGDVLNVRTGRLRRSINTAIYQTSTTDVSAQVGTNVEYAGVHEYGFDDIVTVPEHLSHRAFDRFGAATKLSTKSGRIRASVKSVSQFIVRTHEMHMHMPERSFLRSSLTELGPSITERIRKAVDVAAGTS